MKISILRGLVFGLLPALLAWPITAPWAGENTAVPATTPTDDFVLDDNNGTAYHKKTGLTWKRCHEGWDWNGSTCVDNSGMADYYTWSAALQRGPANDGFAGFSDWRLPNSKELRSIVEQRNWQPAINATVFPNTPTGPHPQFIFWSASPALGPDHAWSVYFLSGDVVALGKSDSYAVRLVRGGQYASLSVARAGSGNGVVTSDLPGIDCDPYCQGSYAEAMRVVLTATPDASSTFGDWTNCPSASGNRCAVTMSADASVIANFTANTITAITSDSPDPSVVGEAVTVNFTVTAVAGVGTPTGDVTVSDGAVSCMGTVAAGTCNLAFTSAGAKTLTATYGGDANFNGSSDIEDHTVNKANTTTTITSDDPDPSAVGGVVAVNYTVAVVAPGAGTPTGNVTVSAGTDSCTVTLPATSCNLIFTSPGAKTLTATYVGDTNFNTSASAGAPHDILATTAQGDAGGGNVTAAITGGTCIGFATGTPSFIAAPTPLPPGITFPYGVFGFTATFCGQNGTVTLTLTYPNPLPAGTQYWKYGPTADNATPHWYVLPATITGDTATFTIADGGLGDDTPGAPDGVIVDQGGPGVPGGGAGDAMGIPTLSVWGLLLFSGLLGLLGFRRPRRHA